MLPFALIRSNNGTNRQLQLLRKRLPEETHGEPPKHEAPQVVSNTNRIALHINSFNYHFGVYSRLYIITPWMNREV